MCIAWDLKFQKNGQLFKIKIGQRIKNMVSYKYSVTIQYVNMLSFQY